MKKRFAKLSKGAQEKAELEYQGMKREDFDQAMTRATSHAPSSIRLSPKLVNKLKTLAESEGEPEYQTMVRKWVEERLQQEAKPATKSSGKSLAIKAADSRRSVAK